MEGDTDECMEGDTDGIVDFLVVGAFVFVKEVILDDILEGAIVRAFVGSFVNTVEGVVEVLFDGIFVVLNEGIIFGTDGLELWIEGAFVLVGVAASVALFKVGIAFLEASCDPIEAVRS